MFRVMHLRDQPKPAKHVTFDPTGSFVTVSCSDGIVYLYSVSTEEPELVRKIDGVIRILDTDNEATSRAAWHPDGRAFAVATGTREIVVVSKDDGERQRSFSGGHMGDITALAWSPNGAILASAGADGKIILWETKTQKVITRSVIRIHCKFMRANIH
jgi:chromosome transmission fidelity protein 4